MSTQDELKQKLQEVAWEQAPKVLEAAGISKEDKFYSLRFYEMQFSIYQELKSCYNIE